MQISLIISFESTCFFSPSPMQLSLRLKYTCEGLNKSARTRELLEYGFCECVFRAYGYFSEIRKVRIAELRLIEQSGESARENKNRAEREPFSKVLHNFDRRKVGDALACGDVRE